jgi:amino acid adenylation domain-containing protein
MSLSQISAKEFGQGNDNLDTYDEVVSLGRGPILQNAILKPVHQLFENFAGSNPTDIALSWGDISFTYKALSEWSNKIAHKLILDGIGPGKRLAILIEPSAAMIVSVLGIMKSGASYVPLDCSHPTQRIISLVSDAAVSGILTTNHNIDKIKDLKIPTFNPGQTSEDFCAPYSSSTATLPAVSLEDPAYMIYTSGSTGDPKGVIIGHLQLSNSTIARKMVYPGKYVFLLVSPLSCDSSVAGIWGTLSSGSHLVVASYEESRDPEALLNLIIKHNVTKILCIPSLYETLLDVLERSNSSYPASLDTIIVAGEALNLNLLKRHFKLSKGVEIVNEYGPTETTVWATYRRFKSPETVSIGRPIPGTYLYVLYDHMQLVPRGKVGELFIGGCQLAKGYFGRPEASDRAFIFDPFIKSTASRIYKTGDLVRWNDDGTLDFIGRKDHQVKIRGRRVELGAIEAELRSIPDIRDAVVVANTECISLSAFVLSHSKISLETLRKRLAETLPSYMIPAKIKVLERFPLTSSGKVDRLALTSDADKPEFQCLQSNQASNDDIDLSGQVSKAWREILELDIIPEDVNFFDLGGHSLMVFKLQEVLEKYTGYRPPVVALFRHTTILSQAEFIATQTDSALISQTSSPEVAP